MTRTPSAPLGERGFTLIELMVVVVIIAIVAAIAIPSMTKGQFDRRVFTDAAALGELVREARTRAVGRGAAQLVVMTTDSAHNGLTAQIYESVTTNPAGGGSNVPVSSCGAPTVWLGTGATSVLVNQYVMVGQDSNGTKTIEGQGNVIARMLYPYGAATAPISDGTAFYVCFTPSGRALIPQSTSGSTPSNFTSMGGALGIEFTRESFPTTLYTTSSTNLIRTVWVPPTGATRITSH